MTSSKPTEQLDRIIELASLLRPREVEHEVDYLIGARLKAWAPSLAPARSSESALPLSDRLDRWITQHDRTFHRGIRMALAVLEQALVAQTELLAHLTPEQARELAEEATGERAATCANCSVTIDRAAGERVLAGRCFACYEYRRRHAGVDAPRSVWEART